MVRPKDGSGMMKAKNVIAFLLVGLILFFLIRFLYKNWQEVASFDFTFDYLYLVVSFILLFCYFVLRVYAWKLVLTKMGVFLSMRKSVRVSFLSMMGRYLPGKVWLVIGKVYLSGKEGVPGPVAFTSVVIEIVLEIVASVFLFFAYLLLRTEQVLLSQKLLYLLALILAAGIVSLHPKVFYRTINFILRLLKRETIDQIVRYRDIVQLFLLYSIVILLQGVAFYFFVNALCYVPLKDLLGLTVSLAVAGALGTLSFFAPGGLGVREGILALMLTSYVVSPVAVLISLLARLWVSLGEVVCALCGWRL